MKCLGGYFDYTLGDTPIVSDTTTQPYTLMNTIYKSVLGHTNLISSSSGIFVEKVGPTNEFFF